ncbi:tyrosine--tRNA ligase [Candidatus Nomurabacteria bacterium RIFCSPLOWO2_12_FULL_46_14]|uniref:Tyrosine--tRNA ligase n=1 Tax=Candidatus Nomurabacteria bacterium RIFCSPLOWO2_12_FULL_46_14 TaxID=1801797 RepID=A0A1F6Y8X0_9BACT|nr:MAG: tyrosine--tRNA ligase [Candidatus Nomurabacteria bacterium RIFCSPLOWO2_12_FULL_46_14]
MTDPIDELLTRGVDKIYPSREELEKILRSGRKLKLYQGFDPTGDKLHIGHMVGLRKLAAWQALGHRVVFLIGDSTGMIGDPSGKTETRKMLSKDVVLKNAEKYKAQAGKILRFDGENPVEIRYNSEWLDKLSGLEFMRIAGELSVQQVIKRDLFKERTKQGQDVFMNEFLYPVMQAYDSIALNVDLELGGTDQMFNMLMGRKLMRHMLKKEKFVMTTLLIVDATGRKIGKTEGNAIALNDDPKELFGKIMSLPDEVVAQCFECLTTVSMDKVKEVTKEMAAGTNPMKYKKELAHQIIAELNDENSAREAEETFTRTFQRGEIPEKMEEMKGDTLMNAAVANGVVSSKTNFRKLVEENAVTNLDSGDTVLDPNLIPESGTRFRIGKKRFGKFIVVKK